MNIAYSTSFTCCSFIFFEHVVILFPAFEINLFIYFVCVLFERSLEFREYNSDVL